MTNRFTPSQLRDMADYHDHPRSPSLAKALRQAAEDAEMLESQLIAQAQPCKLCFGRGERTADGSNGRRVRCKTCDGTGQISRPAQPKPVAQGEAVALQPHKWERKYTGTGRTVWECSECFRYGGFAERPCSEPSKHPGCNADALQATPTIHTGQRVVPDGLADLLNEVSVMLSNNLEVVDCMPEFRYPMVDELSGFSLMLAAAPDAGGV